MRVIFLALLPILFKLFFWSPSQFSLHPVFVNLPTPAQRRALRTTRRSRLDPELVDALVARIKELGAEDIQAALNAKSKERRNEMRPKRILFVRHGQSIGNVDRTAYGRFPDNMHPLTRLGHLQGEALGKQLRHITGNESIRFMYSPYMRTKQTLNCLLEAFEGRNIELLPEPRLREQDFGNFQNVKAMEQSYKERQRFGRFYFRFPNGEAGTDVFDRVSDLWNIMRHIMDDPEQRVDNIVLVTHGLVMRILCMAYFRWTVEEFEYVWNPANAEIWGLEKVKRSGRYTLSGRWRPSPRGGSWTELRYGDSKNEPLWPYMKRRLDMRAIVAGSRMQRKSDPRFWHLQVPRLPESLRACRKQRMNSSKRNKQRMNSSKENNA